MLVRTDRGEKGTFLILRCVKSVEAKKSKKGAAGVYLSTYNHGRMDGVSKDGSFQLRSGVGGSPQHRPGPLPPREESAPSQAFVARGLLLFLEVLRMQAIVERRQTRTRGALIRELNVSRRLASHMQDSAHRPKQGSPGSEEKRVFCRVHLSAVISGAPARQSSR